MLLFHPSHYRQDNIMEPAYVEPRPKVPLSATTTPPKPPAPTTIAGKFRAKLPSRGWMIFWGTVGTIGGLITRDHYLTVDAKKRVADKVDILAKQSCGVQDMPRKVTVYLTAPPGDGIHKTRHYFKQFVKVMNEGREPEEALPFCCLLFFSDAFCCVSVYIDRI